MLTQQHNTLSIHPINTLSQLPHPTPSLNTRSLNIQLLDYLLRLDAVQFYQTPTNTPSQHSLTLSTPYLNTPITTVTRLPSAFGRGAILPDTH